VCDRRVEGAAQSRQGSVWRLCGGPTLPHAQAAQRALLSAPALAGPGGGGNSRGLQTAVQRRTGAPEDASGLVAEKHPQAAASLLEGLEETFTVNRLGLTATLLKCLTTTNIIENPNGTVRRQTRRVSRWQDGTMVLRWAASAFLNAEKKFRR